MAKPESDGSVLWAKDVVGASMNALNSALKLYELEAANGNTQPHEKTVKERVDELHATFFQLHLQAPEQAANFAKVAAQVPGSTVQSVTPAAEATPSAPPSGNGAGGVRFKYGKFAGKTIAKVDAEEGRDKLVWLSENLANEFMVSKLKEYLAAA